MTMFKRACRVLPWLLKTLLDRGICAARFRLRDGADAKSYCSFLRDLDESCRTCRPGQALLLSVLGGRRLVCSTSPPFDPPVRFFSRSNGEERIGRDAETEMMHARTKLEAFLDQGSGIGIGTGAAPHCVHGSCSRVPVSPLARGRSYYLRDRC
jgi:hypothetical protein